MLPSTQTALERYGALVMQVIWRLVPNPDDARDIYQDTFLQYHRAQSAGRAIRHPKAWLCTIARNAAFGFLKSQPPFVDLSEFERSLPQAETQTTQVLVNRLRHLVAELPTQQRQAFSMRHFEDLPFAEIADQLGCSPEAARASAHKATKKLRGLLNPDGRRFHV